MAESEIRWNRKVRFLLKTSFLLFSLIVALLVSEVVLRVVGYSYPVFYTTDPTRGVALRPLMEGWYRKEGEAYIRINRDGWRDRDHSKSKPDKTFRIALLGDSYAEALQVPMEETFWMVMEKQLQGCEKLGGKKVEVINFGVSGYGTAQELITLRDYAWDYAPDLVLLALTTNNDISDNSRALKKTDEVPYFVYKDGELVLDDSFRSSSAFRLRQSTLNRLGKWIRDNSRVIQLVHQAHHVLKTYLASRQTTKQNASNESPNRVEQLQEVGIDNLVYRPPADPVWTDAWRVTEGLVVLMQKEVKSKGAKFLVVTLSNAIQVHPDASMRTLFMRRIGINDLFYPDLRIKNLGKREGFAVLTLAPVLQSYAEKDHLFLHGFGGGLGNGHWNQSGHRLAGELIAEKLCQGIANEAP